MPTLYDMTPLINLLSDEDPEEIAWLLDEMIMIWISYAEDQGQYYRQMSNRCHVLRELRNAFLKTAKDQYHGNL